jgi:hypothetical protein
MFEVDNVQLVADKYNVELLAKVVFSFTPDIVMSPLALPRSLLDSWVDELVNKCTSNTMRDVLLQLKNRPTFEEQWPDTYRAGLAKGKQRVLQLENIRTAKTSMSKILSSRPKILKWWNEIT